MNRPCRIQLCRRVEQYKLGLELYRERSGARPPTSGLSTCDLRDESKGIVTGWAAIGLRSNSPLVSALGHWQDIWRVTTMSALPPQKKRQSVRHPKRCKQIATEAVRSEL